MAQTGLYRASSWVAKLVSLLESKNFTEKKTKNWTINAKYVGEGRTSEV